MNLKTDLEQLHLEVNESLKKFLKNHKGLHPLEITVNEYTQEMVIRFTT